MKSLLERLVVILMILLFCRQPLHGTERPRSSLPPDATVKETITLRPGLRFVRYRLSKSVTDYSRLTNLVRSYPSTIHIHCVFIDPCRFDLRVLDAAHYGASRSTVRDLVEASGGIGAINAGFFDEHSRPVGLHILRERRLSPPGMPNKTSAGVFFRRAGRYDIISAATYRRYYVENTPPSPMEEAVQSYPLLVALGRPQWRWRAGSGLAARTAVGLTAEGTIVLAITDTDPLNGLSLAELAEFMATTLRCRLALNLDGGSSSQLYLRSGAREIDIPGHDVIRTGLGIFPLGAAVP